MPREMLRLVVLGLCAGGLAGCASNIARQPTDIIVGNQGGSWEVVFPGGLTAMEQPSGWETARRDESLNDRSSQVVTATERPSLERWRRLYLHERPDHFLYFRTPRRR